jgi:hypothetical protein
MTVVDYDASIATNHLLPVDFPTPLVLPTNFGLYAAVGEWQPDPDSRFLSGVRVRGSNYGGENAFGVWGGGWCGEVITVTSSGSDVWSVTVDGDSASGIAHDATADTVRTDVAALASLTGETVGVTSPAAGTWVITLTKRHDVSVDGDSITSKTETKFGTRPDILDPFAPITVWAYDECDLTEASRAEIIARAGQILALEEQVGVEREFAARLLLDANDLPGSIQTVTDISLAVGYLEAQMSLTGTQGYFHVGAQWAAAMTAFNGLFNRQGTRFVSPLGHVYVLGGGYVDGLDATIVATSQPYGWRDDPTITTAIDTVHKDVFAAVAERSVAIGYESLITAVTITS